MVVVAGSSVGAVFEAGVGVGEGSRALAYETLGLIDVAIL